MTIRKRLLISNILMLAIPALLSLLALAAAVLLWVSIALPDSSYRLLSRDELGETRGELVALAGDWLAEPNADRRGELMDQITRLSEQNRMALVLELGGTELCRVGSSAAAGQTQLAEALEALGGEGTVSDGGTELYGARISAGDGVCQIEIYNPVVSLPEDGLEDLAISFGFFVVVVVLFIAFLTNRFLIRFVFRNISGPLQTLTEGVRQIQNGNLAHRISYSSRDEFRPVCEAFNDMAERMQRSSEQSRREEASRKELLASISHDVRSPLTSIRAYVEGLLDGVADTPEKQRAYLSTIQTKTVEMDQMVSKLFLFSKMDMGEYPYSPEVLDPAAETRDFLAASGEEYRRRGLDIRVDSMPRGAYILADPTYFRSILMNLLDNSAKYRHRKRGHVTLTGGRDGTDFLLWVDDDGPGVPEEALSKLFDVFYRDDPARKKTDQGSGLGLAIVAKSVERMGGAIHAENLPEGGLRMALRIPLAERRPEDEADSDC